MRASFMRPGGLPAYHRSNAGEAKALVALVANKISVLYPAVTAGQGTFTPARLGSVKDRNL